MRILIVTAVAAEAEVVGSPADACVVVAGIGRTNAAAATTEAILQQGPFDSVLNVGVAGALPGSNLAPGAVIAASQSVYAEEGLATPRGFAPVDALGFALADFCEGNVVPPDPGLLERLERLFSVGPIATVATCSGTDAAAREVVARTGAVAEAMEGAAVVHASRRLGVPAAELRAISNTTGDRHRQRWDLAGALEALGDAVPDALDAIRS